jgi:hypothetical protein
LCGAPITPASFDQAALEALGPVTRTWRDKKVEHHVKGVRLDAVLLRLGNSDGASGPRRPAARPRAAAPEEPPKSRARRLATLVVTALALTASAAVIIFVVIAADVANASEARVGSLDDEPAAATPVTMQKLRVKQRPLGCLERLFGRADDGYDSDEERHFAFGAFDGC